MWHRVLVQVPVGFVVLKDTSAAADQDKLEQELVAAVRCRVPLTVGVACGLKRWWMGCMPRWTGEEGARSAGVLQGRLCPPQAAQDTGKSSVR